MSQTLDIIRQSHKTILFEKFSDSTDQDAPSLETIIDKYLSMDKFGSQEFYREIEQKLTVHSFEEFVRKFSPKVYEYVEPRDGVPYFIYTTDEITAKRTAARPVDITEHALFKMLERMYSKKGSSEQSNLDFCEDEIKEVFSPAAQMEEIYKTRKLVRSLSIDFEKAKLANQDAKPFALGLYNIRRKIRDTFQDSPIARLALAIEEGGKKIQFLQDRIKSGEKAQEGVAPKLQAGRLGFAPDGSLEIRPVSATGEVASITEQKALDEDRAMDNTLALIKDDVGKIASADAFTKDLVIQVYAPLQEASEDKTADLPALHRELESLKEQRRVYMDVYRQAQEAFISTLSKAAQKLLDVMVFFEHATSKAGWEGRLPAGLLVTNCKTASLIKDNTSTERFRRIMEKLGRAPGNSKIWLGILPDVTPPGSEKNDSGANMENVDVDVLMGPLDAMPEEEERVPSDGLPFIQAKTLLEIMNKCGILTVFNFAPDKENTFAGISADAVKELEKTTKDLERNSHAVLAYPNFTLMERGPVVLSGQSIEVGPFHISASYVAAGLIAASQQEDILIASGLEKEVKTGSACVRVDLEDADLIRSLPTRLNRELAYRWDPDIIQAITKNRLGFVFCCDEKRDPKTTTPVKTSYILQARSFEKEDGKYQPLYRTLTLDYIDAYLNAYGRDSQEAIDRLKKDANEWVKDSGRSENKGKINLLLHEGEKIEDVTEGDNVSIEVNFNEGKASLKTAIKAKTNKGNEGK